MKLPSISVDQFDDDNFPLCFRSLFVSSFSLLLHFIILFYFVMFIFHFSIFIHRNRPFFPFYLSFSAGSSAVALSNSFVAMRGYHACFRSCMSGLVLICDMSVCAFQAGGKMIDLMWLIGGFRNLEDMMQVVRSRGELPSEVATKITNGLKNTRLKMIHLSHTKKFKGLGPPDYEFVSDFEDMGKTTVLQYFRRKYPQFPLLYPGLPLIDLTGQKGKPNYVPAEFVVVPPGQTRSKGTFVVLWLVFECGTMCVNIYIFMCYHCVIPNLIVQIC